VGKISGMSKVNLEEICKECGNVGLFESSISTVCMACGNLKLK